MDRNLTKRLQTSLSKTEQSDLLRLESISNKVHGLLQETIGIVDDMPNDFPQVYSHLIYLSEALFGSLPHTLLDYDGGEHNFIITKISTLQEIINSNGDVSDKDFISALCEIRLVENEDSEEVCVNENQFAN
jgi:hypothetical protein